MSEIFLCVIILVQLLHVALIQQPKFTFSENAILGCIHDSLAKRIESIMELLADSCVLSLHPVVNVPKTRWTLCNFWRSHLNLWHIKANISYIVEVHFVFDVLQFCHLLFKFLLLVSQLYVAIRNLLFQISFLAVVFVKCDLPFGQLTLEFSSFSGELSLLNSKISAHCLKTLYSCLRLFLLSVESLNFNSCVGLERNYEGKFQPCRNFAYQQELGSVAKTASLLAALETGEVALTDTVDTGNGLWAVDNERYMKDHNWSRGGYGMMTFEQALEVSSNIGISKAVMRAFGYDAQAFLDQLAKMSYGQPDSIEGIEGIGKTVYSSPKDSDWVNRRILWHAIGYERLMAPIQMLTFYNAIANDGRMVKPTLTTKAHPEVINPQIASEKNIKLMQEALDHVVSKGLGRKAGMSLLRVAGKTATSQVKSYYDHNDESVNEYQVGFCGYFPADAPRYSIIVSMNKLGLPASGGGMAGVVFHNIVELMLLHGIPQVSVLDDNGKVVSVREYLDQTEKETNAGTD